MDHDNYVSNSPDYYTIELGERLMGSKDDRMHILVHP